MLAAASNSCCASAMTGVEPRRGDVNGDATAGAGAGEESLRRGEIVPPDPLWGSALPLAKEKREEETGMGKCCLGGMLSAAVDA
jgi:hypothetical protein